MTAKSTSTAKPPVIPSAAAGKKPAARKISAAKDVKQTAKAAAKKTAARTPVKKIDTVNAAGKRGSHKAAAKKQKPAEKKQKTIRDSFNMPAGDYELIGQMKKRAIALGREIKKSELLRAGVKALAAMKEAAFAEAVAAVAAIKTGRPAKKRK